MARKRKTAKAKPVKKKTLRIEAVTAIALALAATAAMVASLGNGYVAWDDEITMREFPSLAYFGVGGILKQFWGGSVTAPFTAYYPVFQTFWLLDIAVFKSNPFFSHLLNLLLHVANTLLLWRCLRAILGRMEGVEASRAALAAVFAAALFAAHPVNVEPVNWVSGRKVLLAFFFSILSFRLVLGGKWSGIAAGAGCYTLAALSNATALGMAPVLIGWSLLFRRGKFGPALLRAAPFALIAAAAGYSRLLRWSPRIEESLRAPLDWGQRLGTIFSAQAHQFADLFVPTGLVAIYPNRLGVAAHPSIWIGAVLTAGLIAAAIVLWRPRNATARTVALGLAWYLLVLIPTVWHHHHQADRHLYLAGPGIFLAIGILLSAVAARWPKQSTLRRAVAAVAGVWLVVLIVLSNLQLRHWRDSETLFRRTLDVTSGTSSLALVTLGSVLMKKEDWQGAVQAFQQALVSRPNDATIYYSLGTIALTLDDLESARNYLLKAEELNEGSYETHNNLGILLARQGYLPEAERHFTRALDIAPHFVRGHFNFGQLLLAQNRIREALEHFEKATRIDPGAARAHHGAGLAWAALGDSARSLQALRRAAALEPDNFEMARDLGNKLSELGLREEAERYLLHALKLAPDNPDIHMILGLNYANTNRLESAEAHFRKAALLDPDNPGVFINLGLALQRQGKREEAIAEFQKALALARKRGDQALERHVLERLQNAGAGP